jgi:hypothetical protein
MHFLFMLFGIAFRTSASGLLSSKPFLGRAMHHGCVAGANRGEGSGRVVADIAKLSVGREAYYTRELATDDEQYLSGHGESPARWYGACRYQPWAGGRSIAGGLPADVRGPPPRQRRTSWPPAWPQRRPRLRVVSRPTKGDSILYGLGGPATGRAVLRAHHPRSTRPSSGCDISRVTRAPAGRPRPRGLI